MAVQPGVPSNFNAVLEDNGNAIALPAGSIFDWTTDDDSDQISILTEDGANAQITVQANTSRTQMTASASTTAPDGSTVEGSITVDIVPGVTHVYTVSVSQVFATAVTGTRKKK